MPNPTIPEDAGIHLSFDDSHDTVKLAAALEAAKKEGKPLIIGFTPGAPVLMDVADRPVYISYEDAGDAVKYRRARDAAEALGQRLVVAERLPAKKWEAPPGSIVIPKNATTEQYRRLKAHAEELGVAYVVGEGA